jgi:hypothetical protein
MLAKIFRRLQLQNQGRISSTRLVSEAEDLLVAISRRTALMELHYYATRWRLGSLSFLLKLPRDPLSLDSG